jgi:two-component system chemotaxis response regulator CheY
MRILIVDDDSIQRRLLAAFLSPLGDCTEARDGEDAIRLFTEAYARHCPFSLVCLDIQMPGLDGHATLRALRAAEAGFGHTLRSTEVQLGRSGLSGTRILMTTAVDHPQDMFDAFLSQCDGYLVKPIDPARLQDRIEELHLPLRKAPCTSSR